MARRKMKSKTRRSSPKKTNLLNVAQSVILGNAVTSTLFNTNMFEFVTGRIDGSYTPGVAGQSSQITLPELLGAGMGVGATSSVIGSGSIYQTTIQTPGAGYGGVHGSFAQQLQNNLRENAVSGLTTLIVTPIAFKVISKLARKPRAEFNKLARTVGLPISM
jgi:preprotein translocase subunit Sss1